MTMATERTVRGAPAQPAASLTSFPDDQLYMLKLCLELQLEALLLTLGSSALVGRAERPDTRARQLARVEDLPWEKWLVEDLDLACALTRDCVDDGVPLPSSMSVMVGGTAEGMAESLAARYSAMATVIGEMLERTDAREHPAATSRLVEARSRCEERLDALIGESPESAAERFFPPAAEPGHYLG